MEYRIKSIEYIEYTEHVLQNIEYRMSSPEHRIQNNCRRQGIDFRVDTNCKLKNVECRSQSAKYRE